MAIRSPVGFFVTIPVEAALSQIATDRFNLADGVEHIISGGTRLATHSSCGQTDGTTINTRPALFLNAVVLPTGLGSAQFTDRA